MSNFTPYRPGKIPFWLLIFFLFCISTKAQDDLKKYVNTMPPNVASFEKYGNVPITYNTGQVGETIPLYTFPVDSHISIPIELSYNNNGMKPDDVPTWVGHGWDLMPGGYITQDIRGLDDLSVGGMSDPAYKGRAVNFMTGAMTSEEKLQFGKDVLGGIADAQQDIFSLNFLGKSTKFYFDGSTIKFIKYMPYKIILDADKNFEITDETGYQYIFGMKTACSGSINNDPLELTAQGGSFTWYLVKIITPYNTEADFTYQNDAQYITASNSVCYVFGAMDATGDGCVFSYAGQQVVGSNSFSGQVVLQSISYNGRKVLFNTIPRNDLITINSTTAKALSSIQVFDENNQVVRNVSFSYDNNQRLKLNSLAILDNVTNAPVQQYTFDYYQYQNADLTTIPLITSSNRTYATDHWGYYNAAPNNTFKGVPIADYHTIIPNPNLLNNTNLLLTGDNNKNANGTASQIGMLKRITYPTGGYTDLEYEPNMMNYSSLDAIPPFLNQIIYNPTVPITGASDRVTCPDAEGEAGQKTGTFTLSQDMNVGLAWQFQSSADNSAACSLTITSTNGSIAPIAIAGFTGEGSRNLMMPAGTYSYTIDAGCEFAQPTDHNFTSFSIVQYIPEPVGPFPIPVGGNRILRITSYDPVANKSTIQRFEYASPEFYQIPWYVTRHEEYTTETTLVIAGADCGPRWTVAAQNQIPFEGSVIYYQSVTENLGENGENGKNIYTYPAQTMLADHYDQVPYPSIMNLSWRGSTPQKQDIYKNTNTGSNSFTPLKSTSYSYTPPPTFGTSQVVEGVKFLTIGDVMYGQPEPEDWSSYYGTAQVYLPTDKFDKSQVATTEYTSTGTSISDVKNYVYNDNYFLTSKVLGTNSKGQTEEQDIWYPGDYNSNVSNTATLLSKNMVGLPVKKMTSRNGNIVSGEVDNYDDMGNNIGAYRYENNTLTPPPVHDPAILYPPNFNLKLNLKYTAFAKVQRFQPQDNLTTTILWGYNNTYAIAEIKNAEPASVAYTSFEANDLGGWTLNGGSVLNNNIITGLKTYSGTVSKTVPAGNYTVSLWASGNVSVNGQGVTSTRASNRDPNWHYYEWTLSNVSSVQITGDNYDEVRLYPIGSQMTTYTYAPLIGMTSQCDINNLITYYEFDGFARLLRVRDKDYNILKQYDYQYQVSARMVYSNSAITQNFTRNNCSPGGIPAVVPYTVPAGEYNSGISQADADAQAQADMNANGQNNANQTGSCTFYNTQQSQTFTPTSCGPGGTPSPFVYTVTAGSFSSTVSQADADQQAIDYINANGQNYANGHATCTYLNTQQSQAFTCTCGTGGQGSSVSYTVPAGSYSSNSSQADADQQAINDINANGQNNANQQGTCTYFNTVQSQNFQQNNCSCQYTGGTVPYTVPANTYSSNISQADANQKALNDIAANGQNHANAQNTCTTNCTQPSHRISASCACLVGTFGILSQKQTITSGKVTCTTVLGYKFSDGTSIDTETDVTAGACGAIPPQVKPITPNNK